MTPSNLPTYLPRNQMLWGAPVANHVGRVPHRLNPDRSDPGSNPARGPLVHVLPSISHSFLSSSLYNKAKK